MYIFFFTSYHIVLHNAGAHFRIIHNDLMIHITYISTKKIMLFIAILFFFCEGSLEIPRYVNQSCRSLNK